MTNTEKLNMFQEKNSFIKKLDLILTTPVPKGMTVEGVEYEVYQKEIDDILRYQEVIVITFQGGGILPLSVTGNSNSANLQVIADHINGGEYGFVPAYMRIKELWERVDLD